MSTPNPPSYHTPPELAISTLPAFGHFTRAKWFLNLNILVVINKLEIQEYRLCAAPAGELSRLPVVESAWFYIWDGLMGDQKNQKGAREH